MKFRRILALAALAAFCAIQIFAASNSKTNKMLDLIKNGSEKKIKSFIINNGRLATEEYGPQKNSLLIEAIEAGRDYSVIKLLLDAGVNPKAQNADGDSAVSSAAKNKVDAKILDILISYDTVLPFQRKNRILKKNNLGKSAMDYAVENGDQEQIDIINRYLGIMDVAESPSQDEQKPEEAAKDEKPAEPEASQENAPDASAQEEPKADSSAGDGIAAPSDTAALQQAAQAAARRAATPYKKVYLFDGIVAFDIDDGEKNPPRALIANPNKKGEGGRTLLHKAASQDDIDMLLLLSDSGADFNLADDDGYTPLMYAARFAKKVETVAILLSRGADSKPKNRFGLSAIEIAAADNKNPEIISALFPKSKKEDAKKAYVTAVGLGRPAPFIQKFFDGGMGPNDFYKGKSVLMYAAESNTRTDCIKFLLEKGADKTMLTSDWKDAFWFASQNPALPHNDVYWSLNNSEKKK